MNNIFTYLDWRKDLTLKQSSFNNIDNLILTQLSYLFWENIVSEDAKQMICYSDAAEKFLNGPNLKDQLTFGYFCSEDAVRLLKETMDSPRFRNMYLTYYQSKIDEQSEEQFAAITFLLEDGSMYVSYRGTDSTLVGWKEDFNMSFMTTIPSQHSALLYLEEVMIRYPNRKVRVGGHSKGGNLAVYAGVFAHGVNERIIDIYCNDGPGFMPEILEDERYKAMEEKIHNFVPQSSIIGMILEHEEPYNIVHSESVGILQHNAFKWNVGANDFYYVEELTKESHALDRAMRKWVSQLSYEEKEKFVDVMYEMIRETGVSMTSDFRHTPIRNGITFLKSYQSQDEETKQILGEGLGLLFKSVFERIRIFHKD